MAKSKTKTKTKTKQVANKRVDSGNVKVAVIRSLAEIFERDDAVEQVAGFAEDLPERMRQETAAAVLAHTRKGDRVARAFVQAIATGDAVSADRFVQYCATMSSGRGALRQAFLDIAMLASDAAALDAAYRNFALTELDDPDLLAVGVDAAHRLGDPAAAAEREAQLALAQRMAPLLVELAGTAPQRKRATAKLAGLSAEERTHVERRMLQNPGSYDEAQAIEAVLAQLTVAPIRALASAIIDTRYHGEEELIAGLRRRVTSEPVVRQRLVEMFDVVASFATDDDQLEPFIHALWPVSGMPDVYPHVVAALRHESELVRATVFEEWLREADAQMAFDDAQIDELVRIAIAVAVEGDDDDVQRGANRALFYMHHAGARHAIFEAIRTAPTKKNEELRWNLYFGLEHIEHPDATAFLTERLGVEDEEMWALMEALENKFSSEVHRQVMAAIERARSMRAANVWADVLVDKKPSPPLLIELAHAIAAWPDPSAKRDQQRMRYVLEQAVAAALTVKRPSDARTFLERTASLAKGRYSDYQVEDREEDTADPLGDPETKKLLAKLSSGALDREAEQARAAVEAARAAGVPVAADDERLGALAGAEVAQRLVTDRETHEVWFWDNTPTIHVYDGFAIAPTPCSVTIDAFRKYASNVNTWLDGRATVHERVLILSVKSGDGWSREILRFGDRVLVFEAEGEGEKLGEANKVEPIGFVFADEAGARRFTAMLAENPPPGARRVDPWYVEGAGAVRREYYVPMPSGAYNNDGSVAFAVLDNTIVGRCDTGVPPLARTHASHEDALAAYQAWELALFTERGARMREVGADTSATRREDKQLAAFLEERYRDDDKDAAWHLRGLAEMWSEIVEAGLADRVADVRIELGPPASDADIAAYQATLPEAVLPELGELWRTVGGGGFVTHGRSVRFLGPAELVARRGELRATLRSYFENHYKGATKKKYVGEVEHLDVVALDGDTPLIMYDTRRPADDSSASSVDSAWWTSLGWEIAEHICVQLKRRFETDLGDVFRLRLGQQPGAGTRRTRLEKSGKFWEAIVDGAQLMTRHGPTGQPGKPSVKTLATEAAAAAEFDKLVKASRAKGYR